MKIDIPEPSCQPSSKTISQESRERRQTMRIITVLAMVIIFLSCGCSRIKSKYDEVKDRIKEEIYDTFRSGFYSDCGAWDFYRIPLIAPYELTAIDDRNVWYFGKRHNTDKSNYYSDNVLSARLSVEYVGITDSIIYMSYTEELAPVDQMPWHTYDDTEMRRYAIIDVPTDSIEWHETKTEWITALGKRNITRIYLHHVDSLYDDFAYNRRLLFNPSKQQ